MSLSAQQGSTDAVRSCQFKSAKSCCQAGGRLYTFKEREYGNLPARLWSPTSRDLYE